MIAQSTVDWASLVRRVAAADTSAYGEMYEMFAGIRSFLSQRIPECGQDVYHDVILATITQIRGGYVRRPECLAGYIRSTALHHIAIQIDACARARMSGVSPECLPLRDGAPGPEEALIQREQRDIAMRVLLAMRERDREVLIRFYLDGDPAEKIQAELHLTPNQFRLTKSRAKARFAELCRARLQPAGRRALTAPG